MTWKSSSASQAALSETPHHLVSRLDHVAYLGRELARAEHALRSGARYVQDGALEQERPEPESPCNRGCACETTVA
ncbi:MAG: DUF4346 domain-containing protein [Thermodesulfobacteriota bacterium]